MAVQQRSRKTHRWGRRLIALVAILAGACWVFQQADGSANFTVADLLRRVLGAGTTAHIEATYRAASEGVQSALAGDHPQADPTVHPRPPAAAREGAGEAGPARPFATLIPASRPVATATSSRVRVAIVRPAPPVAVRRGVAPRLATPAVGPRAAPLTLPPILAHLPASSVLQNDYQVFETWNNCGPASLSMALSYFGIHESQATLGQILRPYQNDQGNNDDKDVTIDELANEARTFGLLAYHRPDGNIRLLKRFIAIGVPVVAETILTMDDDIGHYRVVKGYDDRTQTIIQDDSMQGHNVQFSYADFDSMWKRYNYEYLVLVPRDKELLARAILGKDMSVRTAWQDTVRMDRAVLAVDPSDVASRFNLSVALYYVGKYRQSVAEFEKVQYQLPARTLWYQIEPIEAYYALGAYQKVFSLTETILNNGDRAFSQLYILRGDIDRKQGNIQAAKVEFENAVFYNANLKAAKNALRSISA
jgi:hypothetical protein